MSLTLPASITSGIAAGSTTCATLFKVTRADASVQGFTSHDQDIIVGGVTYAARSAYSRTAVSGDATLAADSADLDGVIGLDVTEADILAGVYDGARLDLMLIDWASPSTAVTLKTGWLGEISAQGSGFKAELMGLTSALAQNVTELTSPTCRADLGDTRCKKVLTAFTFSGTVSAATDRRQFGSNLANADNYFVGGKLTWVTGANAGLVAEIKTSLATGAVTLFLPMPYDIAAGDTFSAVRGCDKTIATCVSVFANAVNFRGEPYLPGTHFIVKGKP